MPGVDPQQSPLSRPVAVSSVIESHLQKILGSDAFTRADSLRRLLAFVVHETIAGRGEQVKEYSLGVSVLGKAESFDPKADPIVRVQMRRLRERLARYYAADGGCDALHRVSQTVTASSGRATGTPPRGARQAPLCGPWRRWPRCTPRSSPRPGGRGFGSPDRQARPVLELFLRQPARRRALPPRTRPLLRTSDRQRRLPAAAGGAREHCARRR